MAKNNKMRVFCAAFAAVLILGCFTGCKNKQDTLSTNTDVTTATSDEAISTTESTTATTEATTVATTTTTTTTTTKTTKAPTTKAEVKVTEKPTTKAPVTQAPTVKTQLDAHGQSQRILTPEETCKRNGWTMQEYASGIEAVKNFKCKYCGKHDCPSIAYLIDTNGDYYSLDTNYWKCPTYVASEPKCERCGKKLCQDYDAAHPKEEYCTGWHKQVEW